MSKESKNLQEVFDQFHKRRNETLTEQIQKIKNDTAGLPWKKALEAIEWLHQQEDITNFYQGNDEKRPFGNIGVRTVYPNAFLKDVYDELRNIKRWYGDDPNAIGHFIIQDVERLRKKHMAIYLSLSEEERKGTYNYPKYLTDYKRTEIAEWLANCSVRILWLDELTNEANPQKAIVSRVEQIVKKYNLKEKKYSRKEIMRITDYKRVQTIDDKFDKYGIPKTKKQREFGLKEVVDFLICWEQEKGIS